MTAPKGKDYANLAWAQRVYEDPALSWRAKYVGIAVALRYMTRETLGDVRPGAKRLGRELDISEATVKRGFRELRSAGYMRLAKRGSFGRASFYVGLRRKPRPKPVPPVPPEQESEVLPIACRDVFNVGKHKGETIAQVHVADPAYLLWAAAKMRNDLMVSRIQAFLTEHGIEVPPREVDD